MFRSSLLTILAMLLLACSGTEIVPDDTTRLEESGLTRYAWRSEPLSGDRYARALADQADPVIRSAVDERLRELGYEQVAREHADFLIEYLAAGSISDGRVATTASNVTPYPSAMINRQADGATVDNAYALGGVKAMGNLMLVFVERASAEVLWRVRISKVIEDSNQINERAIRSAIRRGLSTLPNVS